MLTMWKVVTPNELIMWNTNKLLFSSNKRHGVKQSKEISS